MTFNEPKRLYAIIERWERGFGFCRAQDGESYFVHHRDLPAPWRTSQAQTQLVGRSIIFELSVSEQTGKKKAVRVFVISEADECLVGDVVDVADVR